MKGGRKPINSVNSKIAIKREINLYNEISSTTPTGRDESWRSIGKRKVWAKWTVDWSKDDIKDPSWLSCDDQTNQDSFD